ncbi:Rep family protein [Abyssicoccus albus]|uniref:Rep family protein n=2 Tax=Bacillati TaxID=1783272 RepID=UPI0039EDFEF8
MSNNRRAIMYVQQLEHMAYEFDELYERLDSNFEDTNTEFAMIIHDKDLNEDGEEVKPHVHVMLYNSNKFAISELRELFNEDSNNCFEYMKSKHAGFMYLIHAGKKDRDKYQYSPSSVKANFDYEQYIKNKLAQVKYSLDDLLSGILKGSISMTDIYNSDEMMKVYLKNKKVIENAISIYREQKREDLKKKPIEVIFIHSQQTGIGKSYLSKNLGVEYLKKTNVSNDIDNSIFITGANNDLFQDYMQEEVIIVDDFKPSNLDYYDLLRLLDPYTEFNYKSRYSNKLIKPYLIIMNSIYPIDRIYRELKSFPDDDEIDNITQLIRRFSLFIDIDNAARVNDDEINVEVSFYRMNIVGNGYEKIFIKKKKSLFQIERME